MNSAIPLPRGPCLEGLAGALDAGCVTDLVSRFLLDGAAVREARAYYIRHKGRDGSLVGWRVRLDDGGEDVPVTLRVADLPRLRSEAERFEGLPCGHTPWVRPAALAEEQGVLLIGFPFDRSLGWLRKLVRVTRVKEILGEHLAEIVTPGWRVSKESGRELIRYKPERRAVIRYDLVLRHREKKPRQYVGCYLRLHADGSAVRASMMQRAARAAGFPCPEVLALVSDGFAIEEALPGLPLDVGAPGAGERIESAGELLAGLNGTPLPHDAVVRDPADELERCRRAASDLREIDPGAGAAADAAVERLAETLPDAEDLVALHGDFHAGQVILDGDAAALVDFDRSHAGQAAYDLASFEAHLIAMEHPRAAEMASALQRGYGRARPLPGERSRRWFLASTLLCMASTPFRDLASDWPERTERLMKGVLEIAGVDARHTTAVIEKTPVGLEETAGFLCGPGGAGILRGLGSACTAPARFEILKSGGAAALIDTSDGIAALQAFSTGVRGSLEAERLDPAEDRALRGRRLLGDAKQAARFCAPHLRLERSRLVAYHPERRAVLRLEGKDREGNPAVLYAKLLRRKTFERANRFYESLGERGKRAGLVMPVLAAEDHGIFLYPQAPGRSLHETLLAGDRPDVGALAKGIGRLRGIEPPTVLEKHGYEEERDAALKMLDRGLVLVPELAALREAVATIDVQEGGELRFAHRDLHDKQIFIDDGSAFFIDFEGAAAAPPLLDIVNLAEHCRLRTLQDRAPGGNELGRILLEELGVDPGAPEAALLTALTRARLAGVYAMRPQWRELSRSLAVSAFRIIEEAV